MSHLSIGFLRNLTNAVKYTHKYTHITSIVTTNNILLRYYCKFSFSLTRNLRHDKITVSKCSECFSISFFYTKENFYFWTRKEIISEIPLKTVWQKTTNRIHNCKQGKLFIHIEEDLVAFKIQKQDTIFAAKINISLNLWVCFVIYLLFTRVPLNIHVDSFTVFFLFCSSSFRNVLELNVEKGKSKNFLLILQIKCLDKAIFHSMLWN